MVLVLACSLHPDSRSRILARRAGAALGDQGHEHRVIDLAELSLPVCDGHSAYADEGVRELTGAIAGASAILLACPIYNYAVSAATKNVIELTGGAWNGKVVGLLCAAGGNSSWMAPMSIANSLMLDFRCLIVPRFVYATGDDFTGDVITDDTINERIDELAREAARLGSRLAD